MRLKFHHLLILGLALGALETWWRVSHPPAPDDDVEIPFVPRMKVQARESIAPLATLPPVSVTNWSSQLNAVLNSGESTTNQAITLLAMFPNLPPDAQTEAAQHASRLMPTTYFSTLGVQLTNSAIAPTARRAIFADLLMRPNAVKLPWLVEVARNPIDTQGEEALFLLRSVLNEDHGEDWPLWHERVATWLTLNPDPVIPPNPGMPVSN